MKKAESVFVRNNGAEPFVDRFDGEDFTIEPGSAIEMEADCAKLIFGFGEADKSRAIKRLGWAPTHSDMKCAVAKLNAFSFHMEQPSDSSAPVSDAEAAGKPSGRPAATGQPRRRRKYKKRAKRAPVIPKEASSPQAQPAAG